MTTTVNSILTGIQGPPEWLDDPTHEQIEQAFRSGVKHWGDFQVHHEVTEGDKVIHFVEMIIMVRRVYDHDIPGSNVNERDTCFIDKSSKGKNHHFGLLVWSPDIGIGSVDKISIFARLPL